MDALYPGLFTRLSGMTDNEKRRACEWLVESGVDLHIVKEIIRQSTLAMTERYSYLSQGALRQAVAKISQSMDNDNLSEKVVPIALDMLPDFRSGNKVSIWVNPGRYYY